MRVLIPWRSLATRTAKSSTLGGDLTRRMDRCLLGCFLSVVTITAACADDYPKTYEVIRDNRGVRQGTIEGDGVTGRQVIYNTRGRRVGTIDPEPNYSSQAPNQTLKDDSTSDREIIYDTRGRQVETVAPESDPYAP